MGLRLLLCQDSLANSGAERSHLELLKKFRAAEVIVVYFYPDHTLLKDYRAVTNKVVYLKLSGGMDLLVGVFRLRRLIRDVRPDVVVSCLFRSNLMARIACLLCSVPLVGTLVSESYGSSKFAEKNRLQRLNHLFIMLLDRMTARIPVHWIANSRTIAESSSKVLRIPVTRISVVYRGRNSKEYRNWCPPASSLPFTFFYLGRLNKGKGLVELLSAFEGFVRVHPDARLLLAGEGKFRNSLQDIVSRSGLVNNVVFLGHQADPKNYFYQAHCFVFPSWYEGFSGALVEAMMAGIPIIASDIQMNKEAVSHMETALLFPVRNTESLLSSMFFAEANKQVMMKMGVRARQVACERFDIELVAQQYEHVLNKAYEGAFSR